MNKSFNKLIDGKFKLGSECYFGTVKGKSIFGNKNDILEVEFSPFSIATKMYFVEKEGILVEL